ncbi:restriction endonuclease subunit S [Latilactobacillus sakei]|uniref:restriction endonuclease subunit S n=1 Tax=Latilactobacillus sakei TaxID=1599 RepID=UPI003F537AF6
MSNKVPQIRFNGYSDDWEERKLGDVAPLRGGFAFKSSEFRNTGVPIVRISNILSSGEVGGAFAYYDEQDKDDKYILPDKSAVLAMSGATTGKVSILSQTSHDKVYQNQRVGYFQSVDCIDYDFISTIVRSELFMMQLESVLVSGAQPNVSSKEIDSFGFMIPKLVQEQQKIGSFFKQLDNTIALHQRKLTKLKELKQGYLQKMFPKNGAKVPELRFAGFADDWEQRKLGEMLVNLEAGVSVNSSDYDTGYFILKTSAIKMGNIDLLEVKSIVSEEVARAKTPLIKNSIIISRMNTPELVGASGLVRESIDNIFLPDRLWQGQVAGNFSPEWLIQSINIAANIKKIRDLATGTSGSMKNISKKSMLDLIINVPTLEEQQKIGSFFKQLDDVISLHQLKLDLLKEQKKGFLQKMFA